MKKLLFTIVLILIITSICTCVFCACDKQEQSHKTVAIQLEKADEILIYNSFYDENLLPDVTDKTKIDSFVDMMNNCTANLVEGEEKDKLFEQGIGRVDQIKIGTTEFAMNEDGYIWFNIPYGVNGALADIRALALYRLDNFDVQPYEALWNS